uniref:Uncharacterized protein n=1 Tax=Corethron hystrix TaxID=216773 RepID=A0A6U5ECT4_9STRA|mmetsp:Transcript_16669/g.37486  ORF Transcript_16669/g.37486 Transcript_16669/m.37486 type:complete len:333 (+) Transcript_16669:157-1155(+)|eukprot:CAMPEP_0113302440 /NCGR_PEP_ID=MMETSP0010_2-20120614/3249_1 /TAXON_ID=216773 ORGANISM="Corethron hystrix, Strain 308" /NCGR_SAMPLE_ID=MMETSP0010_2 /ASSEMBLY_ACC=CAM_ASM_000155 /LENGTH=332 /DNA_ID=CAMNT_0000156225 /DNA_START=157 /DNA_END=1155 /DNA_ORIENTATION=- /assembly_acc=CAM_ASM_000155
MENWCSKPIALVKEVNERAIELDNDTERSDLTKTNFTYVVEGNLLGSNNPKEFGCLIEDEDASDPELEAICRNVSRIMPLLVVRRPRSFYGIDSTRSPSRSVMPYSPMREEHREPAEAAEVADTGVSGDQTSGATLENRYFKTGFSDSNDRTSQGRRCGAFQMIVSSPSGTKFKEISRNVSSSTESFPSRKDGLTTLMDISNTMHSRASTIMVPPEQRRPDNPVAGALLSMAPGSIDSGFEYDHKNSTIGNPTEIKPNEAHYRKGPIRSTGVGPYFALGSLPQLMTNQNILTCGSGSSSRNQLKNNLAQGGCFEKENLKDPPRNKKRANHEL